MDRSSQRVRFVAGLFTLGALVAVALALPGCGSDSGGGGDAALASALADGRAECRRFTTCVPENPCHTGWVTGCRKDVPICTDIGGWLDNGRTCGTQAVCYMGACVGCAAGDACPIADMYGNPDPCRAGVIACGTGQPVCEYAGPAPDGKACPGGVCVAGQCTWCNPGAQCTVAEDPCHLGALTCEHGPVCVATAEPVPDGTLCTGGVCRAGACNPCGAGSWCPPPSSCYPAGQVSCTTGACEPVGVPYPDGTQCSPNGETCTGGICGTIGGHLLVRTASGTPMDMTGTVWSWCYANEPSGGMSRRGTDSFGAGTLTHTDVVFTSSLDCIGPSDPALGLTLTAQTLSQGDRVVGWDEGPPPGLAPTVTASAVLLYGIDPTLGLPATLKMLFFVDDLAEPQMLHEGDKEAIAPDGYPARLKTFGRPRAEACTQGAPCQGTGSACRTWAVDCSSGAAVCTEQGLVPDGTICGPAGEVCASGACTGTPGAPVVVRTASGGTVDLTGTTWTACFPGEPDPWTSRWTSDVYGAGTITHREEVYVASLECMGATDAGRSWSVSAAIETAGDRTVGWTNGTPPVWSLQTQVVATSVVISGIDPATGTPMSFRDLRFVDELYEWPRALYQGNGDGPLESDGFPAQLANDPSREPAVAGRTVTGTRTVDFWPQSGPTAGAYSTMNAVSALVPNGAGGYDVLWGTAWPDGTFTIAGVPEGTYVLRFDAGSVVYLAETDASAVDTGFDVLGRPYLTRASNVPLAFSATGLEPWALDDLFEAYSANAAVALAPFGLPGTTSIPAGATQASTTTTLATTPLPDAAQGDVVQVFQGKSVALGPTVSYVAASSAGFVADATLTATGPNTWTAALEPIADHGTFSSSWPAPAYEEHLAEMGPGATVLNHKIGVTAASRPEPLVPSFPGIYLGTSGPALLVARAGAGFAGMDLTGIEFGRFLAAPWTEYRDVRMSARVAFTVGGSTVVVRPSIVRMEPLAAAPFEAAPRVTPAIDLRVNGLAANVPLTGVGTGPTLSWSPPAMGTPTSYAVRVIAVPSLSLAVSARTGGTSLRIPDGVLAPGSTYYVDVIARVAPAERLDAPLRNEFGASFAEAVTAPFTP